MSYIKEELKQGITAHYIDTNQFKTNLFAMFLTVPLKRETITYQSVLLNVLKRGTNTLKTQEDISKKLEGLYGSEFDLGSEKSGDNYVFKFYIETVSDKFIPSNENVSKEAFEVLLDIILDPYTHGDAFCSDYVQAEKENIRSIIERKIDNKTSYANQRCIEEMYQNKPYGLFKYGYVEDLEQINEINLYEYYKNMISECKIDVFIAGDFDSKEYAKNLLVDNQKYLQLKERNPNYIHNVEENVENKYENAELREKVVQESMDVTQGKLVIGLDIPTTSEKEKYVTSMYNAILGGGANSKMFQNVREKENLAYTAGSSYLRRKDNIFIKAGIEIEKYDLALKVIKEQLQDMRDGNFTDQDIEESKNLIISSMKGISEEQDRMISYYFGQELANKDTTIKEYIGEIEKVTKEEIVMIANKVNIHTIYFLKN